MTGSSFSLHLCVHVHVLSFQLLTSGFCSQDLQTFSHEVTSRAYGPALMGQLSMSSNLLSKVSCWDGKLHVTQPSIQGTIQELMAAKGLRILRTAQATGLEEPERLSGGELLFSPCSEGRGG